MIVLDTNIVIDLLEVGSAWHGWSVDAVADAKDELVVGPIVLAEIAPKFPSLSEALAALARLEVRLDEASPSVAFAAGQAFRRYRLASTVRDRVLADFLIGAHAEAVGGALLTRDPRLYRRYFPTLPLITPEIDHG